MKPPMVRSARAVLALLLGVLLLTLGASTALADHVYSHRYTIVGRVIDNLGQPALGWTADATFAGLPSGSYAGLCDGVAHPPGPEPTTDMWGDFFLCYHVHSFTGGTVTVTGPGFSRAFNMDPDLRKTVVHIRLETTWSTKDTTAVFEFHSRYFVRGRIWQAQPGAYLESVPVNGVTFVGEPVSAAMSFNGGTQRTAAVATNNYGDYGAAFALGSNLTSGTTRVTSHGLTGSQVTLDPDFMVSDVDLKLPAEPNPYLQFLMTYYWAILIPIAVVGTAWYVSKRVVPRRASRDVSLIPGVGRAKARALRERGITTVDRLADADPRKLAEATGLSTKEAKRLVKKAKGFVEPPGREAEPEPDVAAADDD